MDYLCVLVDTETPKKKTRDKEKVNIVDLLNTYQVRSNDKHRKKVNEIVRKYSTFCCERKFNNNRQKDDAVVGITKKDYFEQCVKELQEIKLTPATIVSIFNACYGSNQAKSHNEEVSKMRKHMIDLIYAAHRETVLQCFGIVKTAQNS